MPSQPSTQQPAARVSTLATADPQHYQAMQIRFSIATELCRRGDRDACYDASHQDEFSQNAEERLQRCQAGDQTSCQLYAQLRNQTYDIVAKLQPFMTTSQGSSAIPPSGIQQGPTAISPSASQWAAIDPELTQALFDRYAAAEQLCEGGTEGACTWLRYASRPEAQAARIIKILQRNCHRTSNGWGEFIPSRILPSSMDFGASVCRGAKDNRERAIASARAIIDTPAQVQWPSDSELRKGRN
jgi:hypothetical protein